MLWLASAANHSTTLRMASTEWGVVAGQKAFAQQGGSAVFAVIHHSGRVHVNDDVVQVADNHGLAVLVDDAFEIRIRIHFVILLKYLGYLIILIL